MRIVPNRSDDKLRIELPIGEMRIAEDIGGKVYIASREYKRSGGGGGGGDVRKNVSITSLTNK